MPQIKIKYPDGDGETFTSINALADSFGEYNQQRLAQEKIAKSLQEREGALRNYLIENVSKGDAGGAIGKLWQCVVKTKTVVQVTDWEAYWKYVFKTKRTDLLQRRVGDAAVKEMWAANKEVPGCTKFEAPSISLTKVKS